ncbi:MULTISPECIES: dimethylargininase [Protofrankia]|uniref:Amidinotransferase n=1 Tax=Protofrankia coriariae TaxID=1562887 RepID=A0ABR5F0W9_9ACTN|nr:MULTISPECIES: dimethylargininase [Protofrankia]KLL10354.1 amidinotransferase [Protofrankia coriariae]ONH33574.1 amidinotransferase [Protofrankia sp. BMG5.30]
MRRTATRRHYLMVRPTYFDVEYSINPWMDPKKPTFTEVAVAQWEWLRNLYLELGHRVEQLQPRSGLPDMVFAANGATVVNGQALVARFRHTHRCPESAAYLRWFREHGYRNVRQARWINEGEGDYLLAGPRLLAGSGFRTNTEAHLESQEFFGMPVVGLTLVDPRYYHLDTALAVLDHDTVMYYPKAFSAGSRRLLEELYPDAITASDDDAAAFGLNAVSDGRHVVLPQAATGLISQLRERGFEPIGADLSELLKAGGSVKCCTLELRAGQTEGPRRGR